jgi:beta-N-acetylhexosaminidase
MAAKPQLESSVLRRFFLGFPGSSLPRELRELLAHGLGGVAIFRRNWTDVASLRALTTGIRRAAAGPVLIGIDHEGGTPFSLPEPFTQWPSPAELGERGEPRLIAKMSQAMATELCAVGVNLDFAPMLDLHLNPESPVTKVRSYGANPKRVGEFGKAFVHGMARERILTCAKHFPGHGDAAVDPHEDLPVFNRDMKRLNTRELVPFRTAIRAGVATVMTAHILLPKIDRANPATLSRIVLHEILRLRMRFRGVILADDLGMGAIARRYGAGEAAVESLRAGSDMVALCHDWSLVGPAIEAVAEARRSGAFDEREWRASEARIARVLQRAGRSRGAGSLNIIGCAKHRALADTLRARLIV